jgi:hypothetical protein
MVALDLRFKAAAATFSFGTAQLEDVDKISIKFDRERQIDSSTPVVMNSQPLVTSFLPENFRAKEMHCSSRDHDLAVSLRIWIRGVHRHHRVILSDSGTEQQRPILPKPER